MHEETFTVDIETHLKSTFKSNYQWKPPSKEKIGFFRMLAKEQQTAALLELVHLAKAEGTRPVTFANIPEHCDEAAGDDDGR